jgi:hypothetical protein
MDKATTLNATPLNPPSCGGVLQRKSKLVAAAPANVCLRWFLVCPRRNTQLVSTNHTTEGARSVRGNHISSMSATDDRPAPSKREVEFIMFRPRPPKLHQSINYRLRARLVARIHQRQYFVLALPNRNSDARSGRLGKACVESGNATGNDRVSGTGGRRGGSWLHE